MNAFILNYYSSRRNKRHTSRSLLCSNTVHSENKNCPLPTLDVLNAFSNLDQERRSQSTLQRHSLPKNKKHNPFGFTNSRNLNKRMNKSHCFLQIINSWKKTERKDLCPFVNLINNKTIGNKQRRLQLPEIRKNTEKKIDIGNNVEKLNESIYNYRPITEGCIIIRRRPKNTHY